MQSIPDESNISRIDDERALAMMRRLWPRLNEEQLRIAKENLERYLKWAWPIALRIEQEKGARAFDSNGTNF